MPACRQICPGQEAHGPRLIPSAHLGVEGVVELERLLALGLVQLLGQGGEVEAEGAHLQAQLLARQGPAQGPGPSGLTEFGAKSSSFTGFKAKSSGLTATRLV